MTRGLGLLRNVILARLLAPADIGLFGITLVTLSVIDRFSNSGLQAALVQKDKDVREYLDTAWTVQALRGLGLAVILFIGATWVGEFFNEPKATPLIQLLALVMLIRGLENPGIVYYMRELEFKRQFMLQCAELLPDLIASIVLAFIMRSAWALMFGMLAGKTMRIVASYILHPYRPRFAYRHAQAQELSRYGRWVFLNNILFFLAYRGDNLLVGKLLGPAVLGVYMLAYSLSETITVEVGRMATGILFPAYSRLQGDLRRIQSAFLISMDIVSSISLPFAIVLLTLSAPLTRLVFGPNWDGIAPLLAPLALAGVTRALVQNGTAVCRGSGHPNAAFHISLVGVITMYALLFPLAHVRGAYGVALAVLAGMLASIPIFMLYMRRMLNLGLADYGKALFPSTALAGAISFPLLFTGWPEATLDRVEFGSILAAMLVAYGIAALLLWRLLHAGPLRVYALMKAKRVSPLMSVNPVVNEDQFRRGESHLP